MKLLRMIPTPSEKTLERTGELVLQQIDNAGYQLSKFGISDKVNRHNCIALLMTEDQRIRGEWSRLQLRLGIQKARIRHSKQAITELLDQISDCAPQPIEKPLKQIRERVGI